ncbi:MAG: PorV/PorQ family protein [Candidatus Marinimicrobia bacterium]|nr:PorV/PorQ family protein [Candidatus Neomarinimicrobiota bacterium]RKY57800.1 MAG: hypothetical protein DRP96_09380 [Candidatus Neomarinimicrobiota bacterium]
MIKHIKYYLFILILTVCNSGAVYAFNLYPKLGHRRAGTSALTFLKIGIGSRAAAMGGAFVGIADDASCLYWNPAGAAQMKQSEFYSSRINWPADIKYDFLGIVYKLSANYALGFSAAYLHTDPMDVTTEYMPHGTGEQFYFSDFYLAATVSQKITRQFSWGLTLKYVEERIADVSSHTPMIDIGTFYWTGFKSLRFSVSLTNFGSEVQIDGKFAKPVIEGGTIDVEYNGFPSPTIFRIGTAMEIIDLSYNKLTLALQLNHPIDNDETFSIGLENALADILFLRTGVNMNNPEEEFNLGAGIALPVGKKVISFDYSYSSMVHLTDVQRFTLIFSL